ncbi:MAG TPA: 3-phosphoshikimate 1-carboxyvinyltransferase [Polyangiaceae bacterium]|nr:3-phosphoshikimate 1-carboxyvinyltransferase [Polyangiaceae bacterium]
MFPPGPLLIPKLSRPPELTWHVPGSKSITNRALVLAAVADGESTLTGVLHSDDTRHMRNALAALGIGIEDLGPTTLLVRGGRARLRAPAEPLFVGNSGTTVRFLAALACLVPGTVTLLGDEAMARRPIQDLVDGLRQLGVRIDCDTGCPPITIHGGRLPGGTLSMRGDRSSQYFSALLMAAVLAEAPVTVELAGNLVSRPYVEITRRMIEDFGGRVDDSERGFFVHSKASYLARAYQIEPDASSASYPFALAAVSGGTITVPGLGLHALQGDYGFLDVLASAGAKVEKGETSSTVTGSGALRGIAVDMHHISDTVMTLAAIAPLLHGETRISNVANIRIKETDRLIATVQELQRLGQAVTHGDDWLSVTPRPVTEATIHCYSDHRMAMSFAVLGAVVGGVRIEDPACVAKTYPGFWDDLASCYGGAKPW